MGALLSLAAPMGKATGMSAELPPGLRAELVRLLTEALVADVRRHPSGPTASGVAPRGIARTIVGRLHPREVAPPRDV
jgi:hypothetical protein